MKKFFTLLLAVAASIGTMFASDIQVNGIWYDFDHSSRTATVTYRGDYYYYYSNNYTGDIVIPASVTYNSETYSVTSIGNSAFSHCSGLTSVSIPNSVTSIGESAFHGCSGLTSVTIPNSVTSIGNHAFSDCSGLTSPVYNAHVFAFMPTAYSGAYTIPDGIESIAGCAFLECSGLTSIEIPNSVTSIGNPAFVGCSGLTSVIVENGNSFYDSRNNCNAIIETVTNTLIVGCMNTIIPNSVTSIGIAAFADCTGLTSVTIPNSVTSIGEGAFADCTGLTSVTIPNSVTSIGYLAFAGCTGLTSVTIPNSVTSIGESAFQGCSSLTSVTIPNSVTSIGYGAFAYCDGLTSITIPNSVTSIGIAAFSGCSGLTSITIPNSVTSIGEMAFSGCSSLTSVTIGNSVTSIGEMAFSGCSSLTSITNYAIMPQAITSDVFAEVNLGDIIPGVNKSTCVLYVPAGSVSAYKSADQWKDFSNILPIGAQPADVTTTIVTPSATTADIAWPQVTGAATYTIEIKKNGELICTLTFNAQGQLISITFAAPSRNNAPQQTQAAGFAFTVTSLDSGTTYSYTMTAKDSSGNVLKTESGSFTTTGDAQGFEDVQGNNVQCTKIVHNGQIYILRGEHVYDTEGKMVR